MGFMMTFAFWIIFLTIVVTESLMMLLLLIEGSMSILLALFSSLASPHNGSPHLVIMLVIFVCMGCLGISLLIAISLSHGTEMSQLSSLH